MTGLGPLGSTFDYCDRGGLGLWVKQCVCESQTDQRERRVGVEGDWANERAGRRTGTFHPGLGFVASTVVSNLGWYKFSMIIVI